MPRPVTWKATWRSAQGDPQFPEFGTVQRSDLVEAASECGDAGFDVLIACAFNYVQPRH